MPPPLSSRPPAPRPALRAVLYARYSSSLQDSRSVDDQLRDCRARCAAEGWTVVETFADYAISGAVRERPALVAMLAMAQGGGVDIVVSEALDRISRDLQDIAGIWKDLQFAGTRLFTLGDGDITDIHIGLKGTMNMLFRKDLADKIRRGQRGRVAAGRIPGGLCYGYARVLALDAKGEPERGLRAIDPEQAEVVRRIVREFLAGLSARAIARRLNAEGVPGPRGGQWTPTMINGDPVRQNGILHNEIYIGRLIYNRTAMVRDPATRRRVARVNPRDKWQVVEVPELAIVDAASWAAIRQRRERAEGVPYNRRVRPKKLLSGLIKCGICGADYIVSDHVYWSCGGNRRGTGCANGRRVATADIERRVLGGLRDRLLAPEMVSLYVKEYHAARAEQQAAARAANARHRKAEAEAAAKVQRLVAAIASGGGEFAEIRAALGQARGEQQAAAAALADAEAGRVMALHPRIADVYRAEVAALDAALASDPDAAIDAIPAIRGLIESVIVTPSAARRGVDIEVHGRLANLIALARGQPPELPTPMVAEEGNGLHRELMRARV